MRASLSGSAACPKRQLPQEHCTLDAARAARARAAGARIEDGSAAGVDLTDADLCGAHLTDTSMPRAILTRAVLDDARGPGIDLRGAELANASMVRAGFDDADLRGSDLTGADLSDGSFRGADFRGAIVTHVTWTGADSTGAEVDAESVPAILPVAAGSPPGAEEVASLDVALVGAVENALNDPTRPPEVHALAEALQSALAERRIDPESLLTSLGPILQILEDAPDDAPPEAWKTWLESLMKARPGGEEP